MYYNQALDSLSLYQKLIQYWSVLFDHRNELAILDNVNFSRHLFPQVIDAADILRRIEHEPGYTSPDASSELGHLIRELELTRLGRSQKALSMIGQCGLGVGNGTSNVIYNILRVITERSRRQMASARPEVMLALPNYPVYYAQVANLPGTSVRLFSGAEREGFLPRLADLESACGENTCAVVLTFPNNPAQFTYEGTLGEELRDIVRFCQERRIYLIVDNIYEDTLFGRGGSEQNILRLTSMASPDYLLKVCGPSKDTPFFSGYRFGYWIGDKSIQEEYRTSISSTENCLNSLTITLASFLLLFKRMDIEGRDLQLDDLQGLANGNFGWSSHLEDHRLFQIISERSWLQNYKEGMRLSNEIQKQALEKVVSFLSHSPVFDITLNGNLGNIVLTSVKPEYFSGTGDELFRSLANGPKVGILPGDVFGVEKLSKHSTAFRLTLVHKPAHEIIESLEKIERYLRRSAGQRRFDRVSVG